MNIWKNTVITEKGIKLQAKLIKGAALKITKIKTGTGRVETVDLRSQTEVSGVKQELSVQEIKQGEDEVIIPVLLSNVNVTESYILYQVGFYVQDPEEGEILYCLAQAEEGKVIPSNTESPGFSVTWNFHFKVFNDIALEMEMDPAGLVTVETFQEWVNESKDQMEQLNSDLLEKVYPVGSVYISIHNVNPGTIFGGTWERFANGRTLVGVNESDDSFNTVQKTGGHKELQSHSHNMSSHTHSVNITSGTQSASHTHGTGNATYKYWPVTDQSPGADSGDIGGSTYKYPRVSGSATWSRTTNTGTQSANHTHNISGNTGAPGNNTTSASGAGNGGNLPPYITVYMWKRTV